MADMAEENSGNGMQGCEQQNMDVKRQLRQGYRELITTLKCKYCQANVGFRQLLREPCLLKSWILPPPPSSSSNM